MATLSELASDLQPYILEIIQNSAFSGFSTSISGNASSGFAPTNHQLFGPNHSGQLDRTQATWVSTDIKTAISSHKIDVDAHTQLTTLSILKNTNPGFTVGDGALGYAKIGSTLLYDDGTYFSLGGSRAFWVRSTTPYTYIYSQNIYLGDTSGTTVYFRGNDLVANNWFIQGSTGASNFETLQIDQGATFGASTIRMIYHSTPTPHSHLIVNPTGLWALDEQFGVDIDDNLLVRGYIVGKHALQIKGALLISHFDGYTPYTTNYTGEANGHKGQIATITGGVIYREGAFGKAVLLADAGTNNATNPSLESGTVTNWSIQYLTGTMTQSAYQSDSYIGNWCAYMFSSLASANLAFNDKHFHGPTSASLWNIGTTTTISCWVKVKAGSWIVTAEDSGQNIRALTTTILPSDEWQKVVLTATNTTAVNYSFLIAAFWPKSINSEILVDAVKYENTTYDTPYFDGGLGSGYAWLGTPNLSASTRAATVMSYKSSGNIDVNKGTIMAWVKVASNNSSTQTVLDVGSTGLNGMICGLVSGLPFIQYGTGSSNINATSSTPIGVEEWTHLAFTWSSTTDTTNVYQNGTLVATATTAPMNIIALTNMYVGSNGGTIRFLNGLLDDLVIVDRVMTASEVRAVYESNAPVFAETSTFQFRAGQNLVWADTDGLWTIDTLGNSVFGVYGNASSSKLWGGLTLDVGDILIGDSNRGGYFFWDNSAATVSIKGSVNITQSSSITGSGSLIAGGGNVKINTGGIFVNAEDTGLSTTFSPTKAYNIVSPDGLIQLFSIFSSYNSATHQTILRENAVTNKDATMYIESVSNVNRSATIGIRATSTSNIEAHIDLSSIPGLPSSITYTASNHQIGGHTTFIGGTIDGLVDFYQNSSVAAIPVVTMRQFDLSEQFIDFVTTVGAGNAVDTAAIGTYYGKIRVSVNGVYKYVPIYNS